MNFYMNYTDSLGDFMNILPVMKGIYNSYGKMNLIVKHTNKRFKGFREMLMYQGIFGTVFFDDEKTADADTTLLKISEPADESSDNSNRPGETRRWYNTIRGITHLQFEVDDNFELKYPDYKLDFDRNKFIVGDRWNGPLIDRRRATNILAHLTDDRFGFLDYNNDMLVNCYLIKESNKPFISNQTGVAVMADLLKKETLIIWKPEDWHPMFRDGDDIKWGAGEGFEGRNVHGTFLRNHYADRKCRMIHAKDLEETLKSYV